MDYEKLWEDFSKSKEFSDLKGYAKDEIAEFLNALCVYMENNGYHDISEWDTKFIFDYYMSVAQENDRQKNFSSQQFLISAYSVSKEFMRFAAREHLIAISRVQIDKELAEFEKASGLQSDAVSEVIKKAIDMGKKNIEESSLPSFNERTLNKIEGDIKVWMYSYIKSSDWNKRTKGVNEKLLKLVVPGLAQEIYEEYRKTLNAWTKKAIHGILTGYFVGYLRVRPNEYQYVVPALSGFLTYAVKSGFLNEKKVANYKRFLSASEAEMIELGKNPNNYGRLKQIAIQMMDQGLDPDNEDDIKKSLLELDNNIDKNLGNNHTMIDEEIAEAASSYETDPNKSYLNLSPEISGGHWNADEANQNHSQGIQYGVKLWFNRMKYNIPSNANDEDIVSTVSIFIDAMYGFWIETPKHWNQKSLRTYINRLKINLPPQEYKIDSMTLRALVAMLADDGVISAKLKQEALQCLGVKLGVVHKSRRIKGKLRKNKKKKRRK